DFDMVGEILQPSGHHGPTYGDGHADRDYHQFDKIQGEQLIDATKRRTKDHPDTDFLLALFHRPYLGWAPPSPIIGAQDPKGVSVPTATVNGQIICDGHIFYLRQGQ